MGAVQSSEETPAMPVRMLNEFAYCPRLFHLEWVQGEFVDNAFTVEGRHAHRRVDSEKGKLPEPEEPKPFVTRSVELTSERLGLSAKIDLVEGDGSAVVPVDYKRGAPPDNPERSYEPERVQLCAYGLLLREHGFSCAHGFLYFVAAKKKVEVPFDDALVQRTLELLAEARKVAARSRPPAPLVDSPKCNGCSLAGICLPDEVNRLTLAQDAEPGAVRQVITERDHAAPLYVQTQGARIGLASDTLEVRQKQERLASVRLHETSQVVIYGNIQVSTQALRELCDRGVTVCFMSYGGWFYGVTDGMGHKNVELRRAQFRAAEQPDRALYLARRLVTCKIANCRTLLRRNHSDPKAITLDGLAELIDRAGTAGSLGELLGLEGNAAKIYFGALPGMLRPPDTERDPLAFDFTTRNRRPPKDPINALLSFGYALLTKDLAVTARL